jgi:hypothetical protein
MRPRRAGFTPPNPCKGGVNPALRSELSKRRARIHCAPKEVDLKVPKTIGRNTSVARFAIKSPRQ